MGGIIFALAVTGTQAPRVVFFSTPRAKRTSRCQSFSNHGQKVSAEVELTICRILFISYLAVAVFDAFLV